MDNSVWKDVKTLLRAVLPIGIVALILIVPLILLVLAVAWVGQELFGISFTSSVSNFLGKGILAVAAVTVLGWFVTDPKIRNRFQHSKSNG